MNIDNSSFELLHPHIQRWIWKKGWSSLNKIQENSIPHVLGRTSDVIISAATAGGKTEAAFLPILSYLLNNPKIGFQVLYVSPLKALINDQYGRLKDMVQGSQIDVIPWHGDISLSVKKSSIKNPKGVLIITPESLESLLINRRSDITALFCNLDYIVIDELHSFIGTERGMQLRSLLSRITNIIKHDPPRIAMSATLANYDVARNFLRSTDAPYIIPSSGDVKHEIKILVKSYLYNPGEINYDVAEEIFTKLRGANNLVFTNSRGYAESYAVELADISAKKGVPNEFRVHHGNLSLIERANVERELSKGYYPVTAFCTSTLELGIDIGKVKSIAQIGKAYSVSILRQRLGRSGRRDEPSILRVFSLEDPNVILPDLKLDLIQNIAVIELLKEKKYEHPIVNCMHFSTLIQQILSILASYGSFYPKEGWIMLCRDGAFKNVSSSLFLELLKSIGMHQLIAQMDNGQIVIGLQGEKLLKKLDFYAAFHSVKDVEVYNEDSFKLIGSLQGIPNIGGVIILAGKRWIVTNSDKRRLRVYVKPYVKGGKALYLGEEPEVNELIARKMKEVYLSLSKYNYLDTRSAVDAQLMKARECFNANRLSSVNFININGVLVLFTWAGHRINRTISLLYQFYMGHQKEIMYNHIYLLGITQSDINNILSSEIPKVEELASLMCRNQKEFAKYDEFLSDHLLNIEYSKNNLDLHGAIKVLYTSLGK